MSSRMMKWLAGAVVTLSAMLSQGVILYQDAFNDGTVGAALNTTLDISTDAAVWKGAPGAYEYTTNTAVKVNTMAVRTVYSEIIPESGRVYTYAARVRVDAKTSSNTVPFCVGFISQNNLEIAYPSMMSWWGNADSPWIRIDPRTAETSPAYPFGVAGAMVANGQVASTTGDVGEFNTYEIILDTTADDWIATYRFNGSEFHSHTYTGGNPDIAAFGFGTSGTSGNSILGEVDFVKLSLSVELTGTDLYQDAFDDGAVGNTLITTLDISTNGAVWMGGPGAYVYTTNSAVMPNTMALRTVYVEFSPESGNIYTYSVDARADVRTSSNTVPFCIGFISGNNLAISNPAMMSWWSNADSPWMPIDPNTAPNYPKGVTRAMKGNTLLATSAVRSVGTFNTYQIVLDTTAAEWTATYLFNGDELYTHTYTTGNPSIGAFGFGTSGTGGNSILGEVDFVNLSFSGAPLGGYEGWALNWGVDLGAATDDYDDDGLINVYEYGLGGNPTNPADQGISPECSIVNADGTNWLGYVYPQLADSDDSISYHLELSTDLVAGTWTNAGYLVLGTNVANETMHYVTNVVSTVEDQKFIRLIIE